MAGRLSASPPWWQNRRLLPWLVQASVGLGVLVVIAFLLGNLVRNLSAAGLLLSWRCTVAVCSAAAMSVCSLVSIGAGRPAGPITPNQEIVSYPG